MHGRIDLRRHRSRYRLAALTLTAATALGVSSCSDAGDSMTGMDHSTMGAEPSESMAGMDHGDGHDHMHAGDVIGDATESSLEGLTLDGIDAKAFADSPGSLSFRITQENGAPLVDFVNHHTRPMHLFLFDADLSEFLHVHPTMNGSGTWSVELPPISPGPIRMAANFIASPAEGETKQLMLGGEFTVDGSPEVTPLPEPVASVKVDGYTVSLEGDLSAGQQAKLTLSVTKGGEPAELEPYYGAWAHVAAIDSTSYAAAHLHPAQEWEEGAPSPDVLTILHTPSAAGTERIFVEFSTVGEGYHRAEFTRIVR